MFMKLQTVLYEIIHMVYLNHLKSKNPVIDSLYFVPNISHIFSSENLFFNLKVTPSWHFGSSHRHNHVENVLIVIVKG